MKKILFISRKYPPSIGGMQSYTKNLVDNLKDFYDVDCVLLHKSQIHLFWFLPYALFRGLFLSLSNSYELLYVGDALLAPLGLVIKAFFKTRAIVTVHGLDITYSNFLYQLVVPPSASKFDKVICVSRNTIQECKKRKISPSICNFIPNGVNVDEYYLDIPKQECIERLRDEIRVDLKDKKILLTAGRLIQRKGIDWFLENVFPCLDEDFVYIICGRGPQKKELEDIIKNLGLQNRVKLLGEVGRDTLRLLYNCAGCFIMPNQKIKDDPEGFGIAAIEAASCGLPVIANSVDGINEAILDGKTGWLIKYNDVNAFIEKIRESGLYKEGVREANKIFSWPNIIKKYKAVIDEVK